MSECEWIGTEPPQLEISIGNCNDDSEGDDGVDILPSFLPEAPCLEEDSQNNAVGKGIRKRKKSDISKDVLRKVKNEKERQRVHKLAALFLKLRQVIEDPKPDKKLRKISVLQATIDYICKQKEVIQQLESQKIKCATCKQEEKDNKCLQCSEAMLSPISESNSLLSPPPSLSLTDNPISTSLYTSPPFCLQMSIEEIEPNKIEYFPQEPPPLHHPVNFYH